MQLPSPNDHVYQVDEILLFDGKTYLVQALLGKNPDGNAMIQIQDMETHQIIAVSESEIFKSQQSLGGNI